MDEPGVIRLNARAPGLPGSRLSRWPPEALMSGPGTGFTHWGLRTPKMRDAMTEFELDAARRPHRRRGLSGLGLLLVVVGLLGLVVTYSRLPPRFLGLWPLVFVAVGLFGLLRRPGWVQELDLGGQVSRALDRPRRLFSLLLVAIGALCLPLTLGLLSTRLIGPILLVALGLLLLWRRAR
jgi:hypothetical protein